jgi:hypothetical protein
MKLFNDVVSVAILYNIDIPVKMNPNDKYSCLMYTTEREESHEYLSKVSL